MRGRPGRVRLDFAAIAVIRPELNSRQLSKRKATLKSKISAIIKIMLIQEAN